ATLSLNSGTSYALNTKTAGGDAYGELRLTSNTHIRMWNSSATTYTINSTASLYSQDHNAVDGDLYLWGSYARTSGTDWWSYATDFDGATLSGASRRGVNVRLADSATVTFTGGTLELLGDAAASTTVDRQGSGTYGVTLTNATVTAQFYQFRNMNAFGLSLAGSTTVTSLRDGDFDVSVPGGSAMTIASTTIDQNPGLQIFAVRFATSSAIAASNVTETGTASSFWRFKEHYGNLAGEAFDNDPGGNPGYVRWDDSNFIISISGFVYSDAGVNPMGNPTCDNLTPVVRVKVNGAGNFAAPCDPSNGAFTVPGVTFQGETVMTIFLDTAGGARAVTVTKSVVADLTGIRLYQDRVIVRHEDVTPMSIADLNVYDSGQDPDVPFLVTLGSPDTLAVEPEKEFWIWDGMTFVPNGNITLNSGGSGANHDGSFHIDNNATFTAAGTESHSVGGKWTADAGATFTAASSTFTFTATTSGKAITALTPITFWNVVFNGAGGNWSANTNMTVGKDLSVNAGTLAGASDILVLGANATGAGTVAMTGGTFRLPTSASIGGSADWSFFSLALGTTTGATTTKSGTGNMTIARTLSVASASELRAGGVRWELTGSSTPFSLLGIFTAQSSVFRYSATGTTTITPTTYYALELAPFAGGAPTYTLGAGTFSVVASTTIGDGTNAVTVTANTNDPAFSASGNFTIRPSATFVGSNTGTFSILRDWVNQGTFTHSSGTTTFAATTTGRLITPGASAFGNVEFTSLPGGWTITGNATSSANFFLSTSTSFTLSSGSTLEVRGAFLNLVGGAATTWTGSRLYLNSGTGMSIDPKDAGGDQYATLEVGANTHVRMWNSDAATTTIAANGSLYSQDHNAVDGDLLILGAYTQSGATDYWSYAKDFDGALLAGSERVVDVRIASGTTVTYSGSGALEALGEPGSTTTIDRSGGVGGYAFNISGGSTTIAYASLRHADANGLNISGTPIVHSLSDVDFELAVSGGSMMTVAGATIDANPLKIFFRNRFATSTGVATGFNVKATGVSASAWRFNLHDGNLSGEAFDSDPGGDPGYLIWDDSAANITISGNVYSDEGSTPIGGPTCDGVTQNVRLRVQGVGSYTSACNAGTGAFSIANVIFNPGDTLTLFLDTGGGARAVNVSVEPATNIPNMHLYQNRVIVRHEGATPITISAMNLYDSDQDTDIPFRATIGSPNTLTLLASTGLIVWDAKTFAPGGSVTIHANASALPQDGTAKLYPGAIWSASSGETHTIGGSLFAASAARISGSGSAFVFSATTTGKFVAASSTLTFWDATFSGSGGGWDASGLGTTTDDLAMSAGALTLPTTTVSIGGSFDVTGGTFAANNGTLRFFATTTGKVIRANGSSLNELAFEGAGGAWSMLDTNATTTATTTIQSGTLSLPGGTFAVAGSFENTGGSIVAGGGTLKLTATSSVRTLRFGGSSLANILLAGATAVTIPDEYATTTADLRIASGSLVFASTSMAIGGSLVNSAVFLAGSSTVSFTATTSSRTIDPGLSSFYSAEVRTTGGTLTFSTNATATNAFTIARANTLTFGSGTTLAVGGTFTNLVGGASTTWAGATLSLNSGTSYALNTKTAGGDAYGELRLTSNTHIRMWNSSATTYTVNSTASLYSQDHNAVDGDLYLWGSYARTSGTDWWSYATDFDGTTLSGASRRGVNVRLADSATVTFTGGTLELLGDAAASTTVDRQGSGTYGVTLTNATVNARYYRFRNLRTSGLELLGATVISSLDNGDFEVGVNGGAGLSIASTTIDQNANAQISTVRFATSTGISGANVRRVGTSSTAINFRFHLGNIAGEFFDDDGIDQCGQIRWDDSQCLFVDQSHFRWRNDDGGEGAPASEWYDASWAKRKRVRVVNNSGTTVANAQVEIGITYDADMQSDFDDLRFTDSSGTTSVPFWIESYTASASSTVWVRVPSLPASSYADVFMYYGNGSAISAGSGTSTFLFFDDFEDANLTEYSGDTSLFTTNTSFNYERTRGLSASAGNEANQTTDGIGQTGLGIGQNSTFRFYQYIDMASGGSNEPCVLFATQAPFTGNQNYAVCLEPFGQDKIVIAKDVSSNSRSGSSMVQKNVTYATGWYKVIVDWISGGTINVSVYDASTGGLFATTSTSTSAYTSGGIGFSFWGQHGGWDAYTAGAYIPATPSVAFGIEQTNSGATWKAAEDAALLNQISGENIRLRFSIKN
ncbi:MAG TPA: DUF2341 domain-containing protein, partial [Candidatus Paceibacterota bacterium]|nr:DUF2341 domain-containing protein [Candidatus Paceibacterota bacterium]